MTVKALRAVSKGHNGVGAFILQCKKMDIHYCDWGGSSIGMKVFIQAFLPQFAAAHPQIEFSVSPRPGKHPCLIGHFVNGFKKPVCVRNMDAKQIMEKAELLRDSSGDRLKRYNKAVKSVNPSVRGIWSPYHGTRMPV